MNKSKKALIIAALFVAIGVVGSIISGSLAVPKVLKEISTAKTNFKNEREKEILVLEENVENLNIDSFNITGALVEIRKSKDNKFRVKEYEDLFEKVDVKADYDKESKTLKVNNKSNNEPMKGYSIKNYSIKGLYNEFINMIANEQNYGKRIIIECASPVNINLNSNCYIKLQIRDKEILKDSLKISGMYDFISLPFFNNLKNIDIVTDSYIDMDLREFINAENVKISAENINIYSKGSIDEYNDVKKFPQNVSLNGNEVEVRSYIPIAENLSINAIEYFKVYSDLKPYNIKGKITIIDKDDLNDDSYGENYLKNKLKDGVYEGQISNGSTGNFNMNLNSSNTGYLINISKENLQRELGF